MASPSFPSAGRPCRPCPSPTIHIPTQLFQAKSVFLPNPQSKPGQANPSPAKPIQTKLLGFAWFYSSESGLINGLQRFQIRIFPLVLRLAAGRASPGAPSFSDYCGNVGCIQIFTRGELKKSRVRLCLPAAASAEPRAGRQTKSRHIPAKSEGLETLNWQRTPRRRRRPIDPT